MKRRKFKNEWEQFYEEMKKSQPYEVPATENDKTFVRLYSNMLRNPNYKKMSANAKVAYMYMKQYAYKSEEFMKYRTFEYSAGMLERLGIMSVNTASRVLKELEHYRFIEKANNATKQCGFIQKWLFSDGWQKQEYKDF